MAPPPVSVKPILIKISQTLGGLLKPSSTLRTMSRALRMRQNTEAGGRGSVKPLLGAGAAAAQGKSERAAAVVQL